MPDPNRMLCTTCYRLRGPKLWNGREECIPCQKERGDRADLNAPGALLEKRRSRQPTAEQSLRQRLRQYGLTVEQHERLVEACGNLCSICGKPNTKGRVLVVDHDHDSGEVRGLLCNPCNTGIGMLGDTEAALRRAIDYLQAPPAQAVLQAVHQGS